MLIEAFLEPLHLVSVLASIASIMQTYVNVARLLDVPADLTEDHILER
jgi:hypothetical protein